MLDYRILITLELSSLQVEWLLTISLAGKQTLYYNLADVVWCVLFVKYRPYEVELY